MGGPGEAHQATQVHGHATGPCLQRPLLSRCGFTPYSRLPPVAPHGAARGQEYSTWGDLDLGCNQGMDMEDGRDVGDPKDV